MNKNNNLRNQKLIIATRYHIIPLISRLEKLLTEEIIFLLGVSGCVWMCVGVLFFSYLIHYTWKKIETEYILTNLSILLSYAPLAYGRGEPADLISNSSGRSLTSWLEERRMLPVDFDHMLPIEFRPTGNYGTSWVSEWRRCTTGVLWRVVGHYSDLSPVIALCKTSLLFQRLV